MTPEGAGATPAPPVPVPVPVPVPGSPVPVPVPLPVPGSSDPPGRRFFVCNMIALAFAALLAIPSFFLPGADSPSGRPRYDLDATPAVVTSLSALLRTNLDAKLPDGLHARVLADEAVETGEGPLSCRHVVVERDAGRVVDLWLGQEAPHVLARWRTADGLQATLRGR